MCARERILTIRLLDKVKRNPAYAAALGIECVPDTPGTEEQEEPP